jgi:hypothetical protein
MSFAIGTCTRCGTQNHVFRGVEAPMLQRLDELSPGGGERSDSSAYVVYWKCWQCGCQFKTEAMLQKTAR